MISTVESELPTEQDDTVGPETVTEQDEPTVDERMETLSVDKVNNTNKFTCTPDKYIEDLHLLLKNFYLILSIGFCWGTRSRGDGHVTALAEFLLQLVTFSSLTNAQTCHLTTRKLSHFHPVIKRS